MAYAMTKQGSLDNCVTYEFICDTVTDMNAIENRYRTIGSIAIVLQGASGLEVYISGSDKQWNSLSSIGSSSSDTAGLSIYICAQDEVSNGVPDVDTPDEATIYLVPAADSSSGNLYDEYIYANDNWEKFGSGSTIDLSGYYQKPVTGIPASDLADGVIPDTSTLAPKASPEFSGSISLGRKANTTIGSNSFAVGASVEASGVYSHAEGADTKASGAYAHAEGAGTIASGVYTHAEGAGTTASNAQAHAEGMDTTASGSQAHAEGASTTASGNQSHAEGVYTIASGAYAHAEGSNTKASGSQSHAEGGGSIAIGSSSHAEGASTTAMGIQSHTEGVGNIAIGTSSHAEGANTQAIGLVEHVSGRSNFIDSAPAWIASKSYEVNDLVSREQTLNVNNNTYTQTIIYKCVTANSDASFNSSKWTEWGQYLVVVGNGTYSTHSNAYALDWDGNGHYMGDLYVGCNADSTGGSKVATAASPVFTGSISLGRKNNTTIGENSIALGLNTTASGQLSYAEGLATTASGYYTHAEGYHTTASGAASHAEGNYTTASGDISHAEGNYTQATAVYAHAEGCYTEATQESSHAEGQRTVASEMGAHSEGNQTTASGAFSHVEGNNSVASGFAAHAEGQFSIANGDITHVFGKYNYEDTIDFPTWVANTSYKVGDQVKIVKVINGMNITKGYKCRTNNQDANFTPANWMESNITKHVEIIGNGAANARSNAYALDWNGNGHFAGDIYVGCNADSTGGTKLPRIPEAPSADGSYILQTTVTNGTPTYTWVSLASLSGVTF